MHIASRPRTDPLKVTITQTGEVMRGAQADPGVALPSGTTYRFIQNICVHARWQFIAVASPAHATMVETALSIRPRRQSVPRHWRSRPARRRIACISIPKRKRDIQLWERLLSWRYVRQREPEQAAMAAAGNARTGLHHRASRRQHHQCSRLGLSRHRQPCPDQPIQLMSQWPSCYTLRRVPQNRQQVHNQIEIRAYWRITGNVTLHRRHAFAGGPLPSPH